MESSKQNSVIAADVAQEELQMLKDKLFKQTTTVEHAFIALEKADMLLNYWTQEYLFCEEPDPRAAIAWGNRTAKGPHYDQSAQWFMEYNNITQFINIASDYVYESKEALKKAVYE